MVSEGPKSTVAPAASATPPDEKPKSFLALLAEYWWVVAAVASFFLSIYGVYYFCGNDLSPKASPTFSTTKLSTQSPLTKQLQASLESNANLLVQAASTIQTQANVKGDVEAGRECQTKQDDECKGKLVCVKAMEAVEAFQGAGTIVLPAQEKGKFYCKVDVGGPCNYHGLCVDHAVCSGAKCKAVFGAKCTGGGVRAAGAHRDGAGGQEPGREPAGEGQDHWPAAVRSAQEYCWQGVVGQGPDAPKKKCVQGRCQQVPAASTGRCLDNLVKEELAAGGPSVCKAGEGEGCGSPRRTGMHDWCAEGFKCEKDPAERDDGRLTVWKCKVATNTTAQIQLGETTDNWSRLMQSTNLRKKRTQISGFLKVDYD